jgi:hypothetical protein
MNDTRAAPLTVYISISKAFFLIAAASRRARDVLPYLVAAKDNGSASL